MKQEGKITFRMPAEWEAHDSTWLSWPHNPDTWGESVLTRVEKAWARMAAELCVGEGVHINVRDEAMESRARSVLEVAGADLSRILFHRFPTDDAWVRDHGPVFVEKDGASLVLLDWDYNSWGGKYRPFDQDNRIPARISSYLKMESIAPGMVLEGGSIEVDGRGSLMTTESCLLNPNRNPDLSRSEIEDRLKKYLGVKRVLWLGEGIMGDDTDGHIDDMIRFVDASTIVCALEEDPEDENYRPLQENYQRLKGFTDLSGKPYRIITLPMPHAVYEEGRRLPASYANFYIGNEVVLVPVFQEERDEEALLILRDVFPGHRLVGIDSRDLVVGLGGVHCVTKQQPVNRS